MEKIRITLKILLFLVAIGLILFALLAKIWPILSFLIILAAIDLLATIFYKPLFKQGPFAKFLYGDLEDKE